MSKSKCTTNDFTWGCSKVREVINTEKYQYYQKDNSTWGFQYRPRNP